MDKLAQNLIETKSRLKIIRSQIDFTINNFSKQIEEIQSACDHDNSYCIKIDKNKTKHFCLKCGAQFWKEKSNG